MKWRPRLDRMSDAHPPSRSAEEHATREMLRAMAHPVRIRLVERLGRMGTARAADLAEALDMPANAISYHLRTLARGGVIVDAPEAASDRRDRVWKLAQSSFTLDDESAAIDEEDAPGAAFSVGIASIDAFRAAWVRESTRHRENDDRGLGMLYPTSVRLSREQAREFTRRLTSLLEEYKAMNRTPDGRDIPGDPDSEDAADFHVLVGLVGDR